MTNRDSANRGELVALPEPPCRGAGWQPQYRESDMEAYARANVERALAESRALLVSAHQGAKEARTDRSRAVRERNAAHARAERLAGALRELVALGHPNDPPIIAARAALNLEPTP